MITPKSSMIQLIKVLIICKDHGEFWQTPDAHKSGGKCPSCSRNSKKPKEYYIKKFKLKHGKI